MTAQPERAADVVLTKALFSATGSPSDLPVSVEGAYGEGALLVVEALGLLPPSEASEWRHRFEVAGTDWSAGPVADAEQKRLAEEHLDSLVRSLAGAPDTETRSELLDRFNAALSLYLHTGLERREDASRWDERVEQALGMTVDEFELVEVGGLDPAEFDEPVAAEPTPMGALVRVVPAEPARHDGLCVTAVALYEGAVELHWHMLREGGFDPDGDDTHGFDATDDLDNEYRPFDSGGSSWREHGGRVAVIGHSACRTAVPEDASELRISKGAAGWLIKLR